MKKILLTLVSIIVAASVFAQKLTLTNTSCNDVYIVLHADDNNMCGPAGLDFSLPILVSAGNTISYNFTGTVGINSAVGGDFTWDSNPTPGLPSLGLTGPPSSFNFFSADVWSACAPGGIAGWPVSGICAIGIAYPMDGVTVNNPNCGNPIGAYVNSTTCGSCVTCGSTCITYPNGNTICSFRGTVINTTFSTGGSNWTVTVN